MGQLFSPVEKAQAIEMIRETAEKLSLSVEPIQKLYAFNTDKIIFYDQESKSLYLEKIPKEFNLDELPNLVARKLK